MCNRLTGNYSLSNNWLRCRSTYNFRLGHNWIRTPHSFLNSWLCHASFAAVWLDSAFATSRKRAFRSADRCEAEMLVRTARTKYISRVLK